MKNSEWGAVAYLTHSKYGRNGEEITINNNGTTYYTGYGNGTTVDYAYNTANGMLASSTGNITGIYDLSGNAYEYTAAYNTEYIDSGTGYYIGSSYVDASGNNFAYTLQQDGKKSDKYVTAYSNSTTTNTGSPKVNEVSKTGDGIKEVWVSGETGWFSDYSYFPYTVVPMFSRGRYLQFWSDGRCVFYNRRLWQCFIGLQFPCGDLTLM